MFISSQLDFKLGECKDLISHVHCSILKTRSMSEIYGMVYN